METPPAPAPDLRDAQIAALQAQIAALATRKPSAWAKAKAKLAQIGNGVLAAVTSPDAVKAEKSVGALVIARLILMAGAGAATSDAIYRLLHALGVT